MTMCRMKLKQLNHSRNLDVCRVLGCSIYLCLPAIIVSTDGGYSIHENYHT